MTESAVVLDQQHDPEFKQKLRLAWRELHSGLIDTSCKSLRAVKKLIQLINQRGVQRGSR